MVGGDANPPQQTGTRPVQRLAHLAVRVRQRIKTDDVETVLSEEDGGGQAGDTGPDDRHVTLQRGRHGERLAEARGVRQASGRRLRLTGAERVAHDPRVPPLEDILCDRPRILFVGINPSLTSARAGHHFAGRGNPFWRLLYASGLVPEPITFADDRRLRTWGLGLTNLCPRATRAASELTKDEIRAGCARLHRKVARLRPSVVAFVGLSIYQQCLGRDATAGPGDKPHDLEGARVFVLPNPSGLNASFPGFQDKLIWYRALARLRAGR